MNIGAELRRIAKTLFSYYYKSDPDHSDKPSGDWKKTDKGWSNNTDSSQSSSKTSESKLIDRSGNPIPLYHGTTKDFDKFDNSFMTQGTFGKGFYFSNDKGVAKTYSHDKDPKEVYLDLKNPYFLDRDLPYREYLDKTAIFKTKGAEERLKALGYDGVVLKEGEYIEAVAFSAYQIKTKGETDSSVLDSAYEKLLKTNNPKHLQKLTDAVAKKKGYKVRAYHGTRQGDFYEFNDNLYNQAGAYGKGHYFTTNRELADRYSKGEENNRVQTNVGNKPRLISAYLKLTKPFSADNSLIKVKDLKAIEKIIGFKLGPFDRSYLPTGSSVWSELVNNVGLNKANETLRDSGFDGITDAKGEILMFNPQNIKLADSVVKDENGNVIPLSKRFDNSTKDMRK